MDHLQHFGLSDDPFRNDPLERFQVELASQSEVLRRVDRAVRQTRGLVLVCGDVGAGKSVVMRRLYENLEEEVFDASMMVVLRGRVDADWLLDRFAAQLGVDDAAGEREALMGQIYERLAIIREDGRHAVLIIDDAHALATGETLRELFALVKLEYEDRRLLTVVLAGGSPLPEVIAADAQLARHVEVRAVLRGLGREEVASYLGHRLKVAGGDPRLVLPGAVKALHDLSGGAPGLLNTLADNALFEAFLAGRGEIARSDVERAYADLAWDASTPADDEPSTPAPRSRANGAHPKPIPQEPQAISQPPGTSFSAYDLPPAQDLPAGGAPEAEVTARDDLDSELEAVFEAPPAAQAQQTVLMDFESSPGAAPVRPMRSRAVAAPTEIQLDPRDVLDAPPKEADEVDDLFMELLDD